MPQPFAAMVRAKALSPEAADYLQKCVQQRVNVLITGPNRYGKDLLLGEIVSLIPPGEKPAILSPMDKLAEGRTGEVIAAEDLKKLASVPAPGVAEMIRLSLSLKPSRILVSEFFADDAYEWLLALDAGCSGSVAYLRTGNADVAFTRLTFLAEQALTRAPDAPAKARDAAGLVRRNVQVLVNVDGAKRNMRVSLIREFASGILGRKAADLFEWQGDSLVQTNRSRLVR